MGFWKKDVFFKEESNSFRNHDFYKMNDSKLFVLTIECTTYKMCDNVECAYFGYLIY